tara:strand:+ start:7129 stop:8220 length:1092 start_codon:yes stop_codon:yes gene_type:complete
MGMRSAPSLEVDAMENRLIVGALDSSSSKVSTQVSNHLDTADLEGIAHSVNSVNDISSGLDLLSEGDIDLLAVPAIEVIGRDVEIAEKGCKVNGARTPRRPNLVLVSPNRLMYQPRSAIVVSDSELIRRQLLRARPDLQVLRSEQVAGVPESKPLDSEERGTWLAGMLEKGEIDGFVSSRSEYEQTGQTERRHTLMSQPKVRGAPHFIPPPFSDLIAVVSRIGFPNALSSKLTEPEGNTVLWVQSRVMGDVDPSMHDCIGLEVRHRQVGAILRQAEENRDLVLEQACHDPDGEIYHDEVRVEVRMEALSKDGRKTLSLERLVAISEYQRAIVALMIDWGTMVKESSREVPRDHPTDEDAPPFL